MKPQVVAQPVIDALVAFAAEERLSWHIPADASINTDDQPFTLRAASRAGRTALGQILFDQNALSLEAAYGEQSDAAAEASERADKYRPQALPAGLIDAPAAVEAATEYEKHACKGPAWEMSLSAWIVARILSRAAIRLAAERAGGDSPHARVSAGF